MQGIDRKTLEKEYAERYKELQNKQVVYQRLGQEINDLYGSLRELERLMSSYFGKGKPKQAGEEEETDEQDKVWNHVAGEHQPRKQAEREIAEHEERIQKKKAKPKQAKPREEEEEEQEEEETEKEDEGDGWEE